MASTTSVRQPCLAEKALSLDPFLLLPLFFPFCLFLPPLFCTFFLDPLLLLPLFFVFYSFLPPLFLALFFPFFFLFFLLLRGGASRASLWSVFSERDIWDSSSFCSRPETRTRARAPRIMTSFILLWELLDLLCRGCCPRGYIFAISSSDTCSDFYASLSLYAKIADTINANTLWLMYLLQGKWRSSMEVLFTRFSVKVPLMFKFGSLLIPNASDTDKCIVKDCITLIIH